MIEMLEKIRVKKAHIAYIGSLNQNGGVEIVNYTVMDVIDGFMQLKDDEERSSFYKLNQMKEFIVLNKDVKGEK